MGIEETVEGLVAYARERGLIEAEDALWARNTVLDAVGADGAGFARAVTPAPVDAIDEALSDLCAFARTSGALAQDESDDAFACRVMGLLMPRPSEVARRFERLRAADPSAATEWFYALSGDAHFVRRAAIARDEKWLAPTRWGDLEITINLSKPEKDPRAIARAGRARRSGYPACALCLENVGYGGRGPQSPQGAHPARQNLRSVPIDAGDETWALQYSPYAYFNEHCIAVAPVHRPMHIDAVTFRRLLALTEALPHYFFGSNADLPIVGGSILAHDHFQGGRHTFPMERAPHGDRVALAGYPHVEASTVTWPLSVLRLRATDPEELVVAADDVLRVWRGYSDPEVGIVAESEGVPHNTITPIARRMGGAFELDLVLRCNVTSPEAPWGVFHPTEDLHHIKRENIGLIEVMGLAILPGRLKRELAAVERALVGGTDLAADPLCTPHAIWAEGLRARYGSFEEATVREVIQREVGQVFAQVLECAGVFKWDDSGRAAWERFLAHLA